MTDLTHVTDQVRETFEAVGRDVPVPAFDEVAFRSKVRRARRRRTGNAVLGLGAAAAVVTAALLVVPPVVGGEGDGRSDIAGVPDGGAPAVDATALPGPLYYVAGMRLMAATPDGEVHDLGAAEGVVGSTAEAVYAYDMESRLVRINATSSGEGDGSHTFSRSVDVTPEAVQSAALSGDGRYLAWLGLDDVVRVLDLKAGATVSETQVGANSSVASVSRRGVLVSEDGVLKLFEPDGAIYLPLKDGGYGAVADTAGDFVTVADRDDITRVYDVTPPDGIAELVDSVPGTGRLAPYAAALVSVHRSTVTVWSDGEGRELGGIQGAPQTAGWFDEDYAVVSSAESGGTSIYVCPVSDATCERVAFSESDVRLD